MNRPLVALLLIALFLPCSANAAELTGSELLSLPEKDRAWYIFGIYDGLIMGDKLVMVKKSMVDGTPIEEVKSEIWPGKFQLNYGDVEKTVVVYIHQTPKAQQSPASLAVYNAIIWLLTNKP